MVATAGSATSSMRIKGTLDTTDIDNGFRRIAQGFKSVSGVAKSFSSDLIRMSQAASGVAKKLTIMGLAGATALVAIAKKAPAVSPAIAKISVSFGKIQRSLGEALAPAFEKVSVWFDKLAVWVDTNKDKIGSFSTKIIEFAGTIGSILMPLLRKAAEFSADHPKLFAGVVAGLAFGPAVLSGIATVSNFVGLLAGATVSASLLTALGYLAALAGVSVGGYEGAKFVINKLQNYADMNNPNHPTDGSGQTLIRRVAQKSWAKITSQPVPWQDQTNYNSPAYWDAVENMKNRGYNPTNAEMHINNETTRRFWLLSLWDNLWG